MTQNNVNYNILNVKFKIFKNKNLRHFFDKDDNAI